MGDTENEAQTDGQVLDSSISDALASLSLTTELDSALLSHLNLLDKYMFHVECLSQLFRMVYSSPLLYFKSHLLQAFFELVQANRDKSVQGGVRLGETGYDQRMQ